MLANLAEDVILPTYRDFATAAAELRDATEQWESSGTDEDREAARDAWREAMTQWQIAEVFQIGPAAAMGLEPGGEDLRDAIYSWPTTNACRIDQELVEETYGDAEALAAEAVNVRGLDALEYLIFFDEPTNQCDPTRTINEDGSWEALGEDEISSRRAAYAAAVSAELVQHAEQLVDAWEEGFADQLATAGNGSDVYDSTQEALNSVSNAMFYVELSVKDMKLAEPLGLRGCDTETCPDEREFVWVDENFAAISANVDGFERMFTGGAGLGFDDLLSDVGQEELAGEMASAADEIQRVIASQDTTMREALQDGDASSVSDVHTAVKNLTDLMKTQFVSVLDLELPRQAEGDND